MDRQVPIRVNMIQSHLDDFSDTIFVHFVHGECFDSVVPDYLFLAFIEIAKTDIHELVGGKDAVDPLEFWDAPIKAEDERERHAVNVA